jgi:hypothetical protein
MIASGPVEFGILEHCQWPLSACHPVRAINAGKRRFILEGYRLRCCTKDASPEHGVVVDVVRKKFGPALLVDSGSASVSGGALPRAVSGEKGVEIVRVLVMPYHSVVWDASAPLPSGT